MDCSMPGLSVPHHLLKFAQVHVHCISDAIQPSHLLMPSSPAFNLSQQETFPVSQLFASSDQNTGSFSLSISPYEYSGLIAFRVDWLDLLAVQDSQESSPAPLLESINSSSLHLLYNPVLHRFPARKQTSSDLMVAVTIRSDLRVQEEEICYEFHRFHIYLP